MDYTTPSPIPYREEDLMTYPMSAEGIEWEVLQNYITSFLGAEAFASLERTQDGKDVYWVTATRPFLPSQINDLKAFSAEFLEEREAALKHQRPSRHPRNRGGRKQKQATSPIHVQLVLPSLHQNAYLMFPPPASASSSASSPASSPNVLTPLQPRPCQNCQSRSPLYNHHHHPHSPAASSQAGTLA
ncbi:hypothetical protein L873DRAFT_425670 [Choiromyces venosus 120613-1]|uniref:Uncharacterized protein n=1 Tax=Choiromyces venosus 120613-1 TaxID=1336337 RepID=A0A3N4K0D9_9PEZI|nr:hypothetical protein L873DRAFT_425670 [Choiromyces venosus 120613-1]